MTKERNANSTSPAGSSHDAIITGGLFRLRRDQWNRRFEDLNVPEEMSQIDPGTLVLHPIKTTITSEDLGIPGPITTDCG